MPEAFVVAFGVANEAIIPHWTSELAIEGILLPFAMANEFHGKCFLCVSDYFWGGTSGRDLHITGCGSVLLPILTWIMVGIAVWTAVGSDWSKGRHQGMGRCRYAPTVLSPHRFAAVPPVHEPRAATPSATHTLMLSAEIPGFAFLIDFY